jgi:mRNA interferase MazF
VKRGQIYLAAAGSGYAGKPRPVLIVQDNAFERLDSVLVCPLSSHPQEASLLRVELAANSHTGLDQPSFVMVDETVAIPRAKLGDQVGEIPPATLKSVGVALASILGLGQRN